MCVRVCACVSDVHNSTVLIHELDHIWYVHAHVWVIVAVCLVKLPPEYRHHSH